MPSTYRQGAQPRAALVHPSLLMLSLGAGTELQLGPSMPEGAGQWRSCAPHPDGGYCNDSPSPLPPTPPRCCRHLSAPACLSAAVEARVASLILPGTLQLEDLCFKESKKSVHQTQPVVCTKQYCSSPSPEATECRHSPPASSKPKTGRDVV